MSVLRPKLLFVFLIAILFGLAGSLPASAQRGTKRKLPAVQPAPQLPPARTPLTLEQMPVTPPQISFHNGELTIVALNSTLGDILLAVRTHTGAFVDIPSNATERVVSHLGPGPAREVLASLLNGSHFNYVMLGSPTDPMALDRVILISKSGGSASSGSAETSAAVPPSPAPNYPQPQIGQASAAAASAQADDDLTSDDGSLDDSTDTDGQDAANDPMAEPAQPAQQGPKTPEQLLQELQRQQQGLQQQPQPGAPQGFPMPGQLPQPQAQPPTPPQ